MSNLLAKQIGDTKYMFSEKCINDFFDDIYMIWSDNGVITIHHKNDRKWVIDKEYNEVVKMVYKQDFSLIESVYEIERNFNFLI